MKKEASERQSLTCWRGQSRDRGVDGAGGDVDPWTRMVGGKKVIETHMGDGTGG